MSIFIDNVYVLKNAGILSSIETTHNDEYEKIFKT